MKAWQAQREAAQALEEGALKVRTGAHGEARPDERALHAAVEGKKSGA